MEAYVKAHGNFDAFKVIGEELKSLNYDKKKLMNKLLEKRT